MKPKSIRLLAAIVVLFAATYAQAAITCSSLTSPGFQALYIVPPAAQTSIQTYFTLTCQRNAPGDATTVAYSVSANNGQQPQPANQNRGVFFDPVARYVRYEIYRGSPCAGQWRGPPLGGTALTGNIVLSPTVGVSTSVTVNYWGCVPAGQNALVAGVYTDTVTMTATAPAAVTGTFPVRIVTPTGCAITTAPGNVAFTYTSFSLSAANASTTFGATCTNLMPYTLSLDAPGGTLLGLNYTLSINPVPATGGTGVQKTHTINGSIAAGQAGTCATASCTGSQARVLTLTY